VERDHGPSAEGAASFHTTRWTIVMRAAQSQAQGGQSALAELCRLYWYPLYIFARRRGHSPDDAQDLTQGFFLRSRSWEKRLVFLLCLHAILHSIIEKISPSRRCKSWPTLSSSR